MKKQDTVIKVKLVVHDLFLVEHYGLLKYAVYKAIPVYTTSTKLKGYWIISPVTNSKVFLKPEEVEVVGVKRE